MTGNGTICDQFLQQAAATPGATAVITDGETTYAELRQRMFDIADALAARKLEPETAVAIVMTRDVDMVAALLAVWFVGCAYVPLDPDDPPTRIARMITNSGARLLLCNAGTRQVVTAVRAVPCPIEMIDTGDLAPGQGTASVVSKARPTGLAVVVHTSGSTGTPKGVELEHAGFSNMLHEARNFLQFTARDRCLATATISYDMHIFELFLPLICGGATVVRDARLWLEPARLAAQIATQEVTIAHTCPSVWAEVLAAEPNFPQLKASLSIGEPIDHYVAQRLAQVSAQAWNCYGPTEASLVLTARRLEPDAADLANVGHLIGGTAGLVVGPDGAVLPAGERGELLLSGVCLARGYRGSAAYTAERFVEIDGVRHYRTGDLALIRPTGEICFHGRIDSQLKVHGIRIEPAEIESALNSHPNVAANAVAGVTGRAQIPTIAAAVVLQEATTTIELSNWLAERLPDYMLPNHYHVLGALPRLRNGKVDRAATRALLQAELEESPSPQAQSADSAALSTQEMLQEVWRRLLHVESVGPEDNFFELGGDSLIAVRMVARVESALGLTIPIKTVFETPSLRALAAAIDKLGSDANPTASGLIALADRAGTPLLFCGAHLTLAGSPLWPNSGSVHAVATWARGTQVLTAGTLEALAAIHVQEILERWPEGPLRLAGVEFHALLALEIARQLETVGRVVEFLFLLDPLELNSMATGSARVAAVLSSGLISLTRPVGGLRQAVYALAHLGKTNEYVAASKLVPREDWPEYWYFERRLAARYRPLPRPLRTLIVDTGAAEGRVNCAAWAGLFAPQAKVVTLQPAADASRWQGELAEQWLGELSRFALTTA